MATSSRAAVELADTLYKLDDDVAGARECYAFAAEHGSGAVWEAATVNRAYILAADGDRDGAGAAFQAVAARRHRAAGMDVTDDTARRFASALTSLILRNRSRRLLRCVGVTFYRARRLRRRFLPGGLRTAAQPSRTS